MLCYCLSSKILETIRTSKIGAKNKTFEKGGKNVFYQKLLFKNSLKNKYFCKLKTPEGWG